MRNEGSLFKVVDSHWMKLMKEVSENTLVLVVTEIPHILSILRDSFELLETIQVTQI